MQQWNGLINTAAGSLPYALAWYLDSVAENWGALVLNNYQAVMPLVWLRKLGIKCLYQPYYCQQLGVFSPQPVSTEVYREFLIIAAKQFPYININLNPSAAPVMDEFVLTKKKNLLLALDSNYASLQKNYSVSHKRNIARAGKAQLVFTEQCDLKTFQRFYLENVNRAKENFKPKHEKIFKKLTQLLISNGAGAIFTVSDANHNLQAAVLLVEHKKRLSAIINTSSAEGKKHGASHYVFDQIIQKFAGSGLILDFEGSSIAGVARFYEGFGASEETFYAYKYSVIKNLSQRFA